MNAAAPQRVLVTGATGFLGRHVCRALLDAGHSVRALCRSPDEALAAQGVEVVRGDVTDLESMRQACRGVDALIHGAGFVSRDKRDTKAMMHVHVTGTRVCLQAAAAAEVARVIHLSTSGVCAVGPDPDVVFHEDDPAPLSLLVRWPYYLSKHLAERAAADALRLARQRGEHTPTLITLNPTLALGPGDVRCSSTADVRRFLRREIPIIPSGGLSFVDVRDVAATCVAALDRGEDGARYLLSAINLTFAEFFERLTEVSGVPGPLVPVAVPRGLAKLGVGLLEKVAGALGSESPVSSAEADMAAHYWYVDPRRAQSALGFSARDTMQTLLDCVRDIRGESRPAAAAG